MKRLTRHVLGIAALPFFACDTSPVAEADLADAADVSVRASALASDIVVAHFEVRAPEPTVKAAAARAATSVPTDTDVVKREVPAASDAGDAGNADAGAGSADAGAGAADGSDSVLSPPPIAGRWLVDAGRLVLANGEAFEDAWAKGDAKLVKQATKDDGLFLATRTIAAEALPSAFTALAGGEVRVFDEAREVCVARVLGAEAMRVDAKLVHLPDAWGDEEDVTVPEHDAASVFESGVTLLTAGLEPIMGDCSHGLWAAPVGATSPTLFREARLSAKVKRQALAAFRKLPAWHERQRAMLEMYADADTQASLAKERWDTYEGAKPEVTLYRSHDGAREIVVVQGDSAEGCGSPGQQMTTFFERRHEGKDTRFVEVASLEWRSAPSALVDLEGDGSLELIDVGGGVLERVTLERLHPEGAAPSEANEWVDGRLETLMSYEVPDITSYGCGC